MTLPEMLDIAARGAEVGCTEALFTLGVPQSSCFLLRCVQVISALLIGAFYFELVECYWYSKSCTYS